MKLAIIGSRAFTDHVKADTVFDSLFARKEPSHDGYEVTWAVDEIVSGGARGADRIGARIASVRGIKLTEFIPDWEKHGKRAGFIRNEDIVKSSDMVLAFWDGVSKGTQNSLSIAKRLKKPTLIVYI